MGRSTERGRANGLRGGEGTLLDSKIRFDRTEGKKNEKVPIRETKSPRGGSPACWGFRDKAPCPSGARRVA